MKKLYVHSGTPCKFTDPTVEMRAKSKEKIPFFPTPFFTLTNKKNVKLGNFLDTLWVLTDWTDDRNKVFPYKSPKKSQLSQEVNLKSDNKLSHYASFAFLLIYEYNNLPYNVEDET